MTKSSVKDVNLETIIDMQSWCKTWPPNGSSHIREKHKLLRKQKRAHKSSWSRRGNQTSFTPATPWNMAKICEDLRHHTDQKQTGLRKERYAGLRKGLLQYCCNQVWMKNGGRIPWNVAAICGTYKITYLMGRHRMRGDLEYHLMDQLFHLGQWSNITPFLLKTCRDSISLAKKSYQVFSSAMYCKRGLSGNETFWSQTLRNWKRWTHLKPMLKDSVQRKVQRPKMVKNIYIPGRRWNSQTVGSENIHSQAREKNKDIFWESQTGLLQPHSKTHRCMMVKQEMIFGPFQEIHLPSSR